MMRTAIVFAVLCAAPFTVFSQAGQSVLVADFNKTNSISNIGTDFGTWDKDPADPTQGCRMKFVRDDSSLDPKGHSLRLEYDVDSPHPAFNGFWLKLGGRKAADFRTLSFSIKGDGESGFPESVKIEIKTTGGKALSLYIHGIKGEWQTFDIMLEPLANIGERISEFTIVFEDTVTRPKVGAILLDQILLKR
ncbi:MAG: hypothetical protein ACK42A_08290 [Pyrinomonadaceae bacterium]|jgi:hypothetical protein